MAESDIFCHLRVDVDNIVKLLKTNAFILEKFLDTAFRGPIRFRQKVLMVFFDSVGTILPWKRRPSSCRTAFLVFSVATLQNR